MGALDGAEDRLGAMDGAGDTEGAGEGHEEPTETVSEYPEVNS